MLIRILRLTYVSPAETIHRLKSSSLSQSRFIHETNSFSHHTSKSILLLLINYTHHFPSSSGTTRILYTNIEWLTTKHFPTSSGDWFPNCKCFFSPFINTWSLIDLSYQYNSVFLFYFIQCPIITNTISENFIPSLSSHKFRILRKWLGPQIIQPFFYPLPNMFIQFIQVLLRTLR